MSSTLALPRGIETVNNSPEISRYYGDNNLPYENTAQVLSEVLAEIRYKGQTFNVNGIEWWFKNGILENDLVPKNKNSFKKNIFFTTSLSILGLTSFDELTSEIVKNWIVSLAIVESDEYLYYYEITDEVINYNFNLTSPNWAIEGVTDEASFVNWLATRNSSAMNDLTNILVTNFIFTDDTIKCNMTADGTSYDLSYLDLTNAYQIGFVNGLRSLDLGNNQITNLDGFTPNNSLKNLNLDDNQITSLSGFIPNTSLQSLYLINNQITNLDGFIPNISLQSLYLINNQITNLDGFTLNDSLEDLHLDNNQITSLSGLTFNDSLQYLNLDNNQITTADYTSMESWASALPVMVLEMNSLWSNNINSIAGTTLQNILESKNWVIND